MSVNGGLEMLNLLNRINKTINKKFEYTSDKKQYGVDDYWCTPFELYASRKGDCEDIAIAKYFALKSIGVPSTELKLVYVMALDFGCYHMVLAYGDEQLILDNLINEMKPMNERSDLKPLFAFNEDFLWTYQGSVLVLTGGVERYSVWVDLLRRMKSNPHYDFKQ